MDALSDNETFKFDEDFLNRYTSLLNKYLLRHPNHPNDAEYSALELVRDLQQQLGCLGAVFLRLRSDQVPWMGLHYTPYRELEERMQVILDCTKVWATTDGLLKTEHLDSNGITIMAEVPPMAGDRIDYVEIDFIPVPCFTGSGTRAEFAYLLMLIDPMYLKPFVIHRDERESQRAALAHFLRSWWLKITTPKEWLADWILAQKEVPSERKDLTLLSVATLPELVAIGNRCAGHLRTGGTTKSNWFDLEDDSNKSFWKKWTPCSMIFEHKSQHLTSVRDRGKSLYYWCRWIESHHDLEKEHAVTALSSPQREESGISVSDWVKMQREETAIVDKKLEKLRGVATTAFLEERDEIAPKGARKKPVLSLPIGRESLLCFSLNQWLAQDGQLRKDINNNVLSDIEGSDPSRCG